MWINLLGTGLQHTGPSCLRTLAMWFLSLIRSLLHLIRLNFQNSIHDNFPRCPVEGTLGTSGLAAHVCPDCLPLEMFAANLQFAAHGDATHQHGSQCGKEQANPSSPGSSRALSMLDRLLLANCESTVCRCLNSVSIALARNQGRQEN